MDLETLQAVRDQLKAMRPIWYGEGLVAQVSEWLDEQIALHASPRVETEQHYRCACGLVYTWKSEQPAPPTLRVACGCVKAWPVPSSHAPTPGVDMQTRCPHCSFSPTNLDDYCAKHRPSPEPAQDGARETRWFPIQVGGRGYTGKPHPLRVPWAIAELAYAEYAKRYGNGQTQERMAERGGFGPGEMDLFLPDWRERCDENSQLKAEIARLQKWQDDAIAYESKMPAMEDEVRRLKSALAQAEQSGRILAAVDGALTDAGARQPETPEQYRQAILGLVRR